MSRRRTLVPRRWLAVLVAMVPVAALLPMFVMASPASADITSYIYDFSVSSALPPGNNCLDDWEDNLDPGGGAVVDVFQCNGSLAQRFDWNSANNTLLLDSSSLCLDVAGGGTADGTPVRLYACNGTPAQTWVPDTTSIGGPAQLVNPQSGKCLDDPDGLVTPPGGPPIQLQIWDCISNDLNQIWNSPAW